jgi:hypothetical protein
MGKMVALTEMVETLLEESLADSRAQLEAALDDYAFRTVRADFCETVERMACWAHDRRKERDRGEDPRPWSACKI